MAPYRSIAVFLLLFVQLNALTAQDSLLYRKVTIPDTVCTVETALKIIEHETGLFFAYNSGLINKNKVISFGADQERFIDAISRIFNDATLDFSVIGKHLVVYRSLKTRSANPESKTDSVYYFEIRGRVFDLADRQPLPFSSIYLNGKSIGTISNEEGRFLLKLSSANLAETLNISCIGYTVFSAPVSLLINTTKDYYLKANEVSIQEVIIRKVSPVLLLQAAIEKININYPQKPAILTAFYREIIQRGNHYMMVSEAILENYKTSYNSTSSDKVKILKGRKSQNTDHGDSLILKLKAGLSTMLLLDVVKNAPGFLTLENMPEYNYKLVDMVIEDGKDNYVIEFSPKESESGAFYSGRIILGVQDLAFKWVEFYLSPEQLGRASGHFIVKKPANLKVKMLKATYKVAFRQSGSKYYLHQIQCETGFRIRYRKQLSGSSYSTRLEMAVTDIDTVDVGRFPARETAKLGDFFTEQIGTYDELFWGEYNFLTPDESLEDALVKLGKAHESRKEDNDE